MILILGGTKDTHSIIKELSNEQFIISVATKYGFERFFELYGSCVVKIRFDDESLKHFIATNNISKIIDTTHPFANKITKIAKHVCKEANIEYVYKKRAIINKTNINYDKSIFFDDIEHLKKFLKLKCNSILFTIGSNNLGLFKEFFDSGYFRILPFEDSIKRCKNLGISSKRIVAMEGTFSKELNMALIKEFNIDCLVTKNSGEHIYTKINAAKEMSIYALIINAF